LIKACIPTEIAGFPKDISLPSCTTRNDIIFTAEELSTWADAFWQSKK
jgi:hypothetical protein